MRPWFEFEIPFEISCRSWLLNCSLHSSVFLFHLNDICIRGSQSGLISKVIESGDTGSCPDCVKLLIALAQVLERIKEVKSATNIFVLMSFKLADII